MRSFLLKSTLIVLVLAVSGFAQSRGGGVGGAGSAGGRTAMGGGFRGGNVSFRNLPPGGGTGSLPRTTVGGSFGFRGGRFGFPHSGFNNFGGGRFGFNHRQFGRFGFRHSHFNNGFGFGYATYWPYYGYYDPFYSSSYSSYDSRDESERQHYDAELNDLRDEVRMLREERMDRAEQERTMMRESEPESKQSSREDPATTLVFRDGRRLEARNYVIAGPTLWIFNQSNATKYPVSEIDVQATKMVNEPRGVEFSLPRK